MKILLLFIGIILHSISAFPQGGSASLTGETDFKKEGDTVTLIVFKEGYFNSAPESEIIYKTTVNKKRFKFKVEISNHPVYFTLNLGSKVISGYMIEANDDIFISKIDRSNKLTVSGKGSEKFIIKGEFNDLDDYILANLKRDQPDNILDDFKLKDSVFRLKKKLLEDKRNLLKEITYSLLLADIISQNYSKSYYITHYQKKNQELFTKALQSYSHPKDIVGAAYKLDKMPYVMYSNEYVSSIISKYQFDSCYVKQEDFDIKKCFDHLNRSYQGTFRDKLLTFLIYSNKKSSLATHLIDQLLPSLQNPMYKAILMRLKSVDKIGARAFDFVLPNEDGNHIGLSAMKNKVVVIDFWYTGCPACPQVVPFLSNLKKQFKKEDLEIISISIDKNKKVWLNSIGRNQYTIPGELNLYTEGLGDAHPLIKHYDIKGYPTLLVIDKNGRMCETPVDPRLDNGQSLTRIVSSAL